MTDPQDYQMEPYPGEPKSDDWIAIPEALLSDVAREIDPVWEAPSADRLEKLRQLNARGTTTDVNRSLILALVEYLKEGAEEPDWQVGIYGNGWGELARELELALEGRLTCRECGGEGFVWSEESYHTELARIAKETGESEEEIRRAEGDWIGNVTCPTCKGGGVARIGAAAGEI